MLHGEVFSKFSLLFFSPVQMERQLTACERQDLERKLWLCTICANLALNLQAATELVMNDSYHN